MVPSVQVRFLKWGSKPDPNSLISSSGVGADRGVESNPDNLGNERNYAVKSFLHPFCQPGVGIKVVVFTCKALCKVSDYRNSRNYCNVPVMLGKGSKIKTGKLSTFCG